MTRKCAILLVLPLLGGATPPEDFLSIKEWWGNFTISIDASLQESGGARDSSTMPYSKTRSIHDFVSCDVHLNSTSSGGFIPSGTPPSNDELQANLKTARTWNHRASKGQPPLTCTYGVTDTYEMRELISGVDGSPDGSGGANIGMSAHGAVRIRQSPMLLVDAGKGVYHLNFLAVLGALGDLEHSSTRTQWSQEYKSSHYESLTRKIRGPGVEIDAARIAPRLPFVVDQQLPNSTARLSGSVSYVLPVAEFKNGKALVTLQWSLTPGPPEDVELLLEPGLGFEEWRPKASLDESVAGAHLPVKATLQKKGGGVPQGKAASIAFHLLDVSREPGTCMNWPEQPKSPAEPDLRFEASMNAGFQINGPLEAVRSGDDLTKVTAVVSAYDWGAFGEIQAVATLKNGREIVSEITGDPGRRSLSIPKCASGSHIADAWKVKTKATGRDDDDDDDKPVGDGTKGDGLTLYEEYRGFMQEGRWISGAPNDKDFFIFDTIGGRSKSGIRKFRDVTRLEVHHRLRASETGRKGVINCNFARGPHRVDQHWVMLATYSELAYAQAVGGPGLPREITSVLMPVDFALIARANASEAELDYLRVNWERTLAHELLHCCNVYHHGDRDTGQQWVSGQDSDGSWKYWLAGPSGRTGPPIRLYREPDQPYPPRKAGTLDIVVGEPHGQHSGAEDCLMRYDNASVYRKAANEYVWIQGQEPCGDGLCSQREGTTYNKFPRQEGANYLSRHQGADATQDRGRCQFQLCVNDAAKPKRRGK